MDASISNVVKIVPRRRHDQVTCSCNAYPFPHRADSGQCEDPGPKPASCRECRHGEMVIDPYGTGDRWFSQLDCDGCHWD